MEAPKEKTVQIRLTKKDRERVERIAKAHYLDVSSWVRMTILRAVDAWEAEQGGGG